MGLAFILRSEMATMSTRPGRNLLSQDDRDLPQDPRFRDENKGLFAFQRFAPRRVRLERRLEKESRWATVGNRRRLPCSYESLNAESVTNRYLFFFKKLRPEKIPVNNGYV